MNRKNFEDFIGKQVDVFLIPNIEHISGVISKCEDDYVMIGDELWAYPAILGIRPRSQAKTIQKTITPKQQQPKKPEPQHEVQQSQAAEEVMTPPEEPKPQEVDMSKFEGREFSGTLVSFFYERGAWGFIESEEVKKCNIPLRDGEKVFVHIKQITDEALRQKLMNEKNPNPQIEVVFKLTQNPQGVAADDVREKNPDKTLKIDMASAIYEEGEIEFFRRYEEIPHGEIRVKGNKLYRFDESDVVDPFLAVFLECSPSAEGQQVKFIKTMGNRGKMKATHVSASVPFPEEKIHDWERSGLLQKAKERLKIS